MNLFITNGSSHFSKLKLLPLSKGKGKDKIFKLRGGASRTSHVGRSVGPSVGPSVGRSVRRSLENFDNF